jgi:hypothetical protein
MSENSQMKIIDHPQKNIIHISYIIIYLEVHRQTYHIYWVHPPTQSVDFSYIFLGSPRVMVVYWIIP